MGNTNQKSPFLQYRTKDTNQLITIDLSSNSLLPQQPSDKEVAQACDSVLKELSLTEDQKKMILGQAKKTQWKIVCHHREVMSQIKQNAAAAAAGEKQKPARLKSMAVLTQAEIYTKKLRENPTQGLLRELRAWLKFKASIEDLREFITCRGLDMLFDACEVAEQASRTSFNFQKQIEILKILEHIWNTELGKQTLVTHKYAATLIFKNYQQYNYQLLKLSLDLLGKMLWHSNDTFELVMDAMNKYKVERGLRFKFESFMITLRESKNILVIEAVILFLVVICESQIDERRKANTKTELVLAGIPQILEVPLFKGSWLIICGSRN